MLTINRIDHLVLTVKDINKTVTFYESVMGMRKETFGEGRVALVFGEQKINLHEFQNEYEPKARLPIPGSADLCFIADTTIDNAISHVTSKGVEIIEGPVKRTGATGVITSIYFRDPDGNLIEVSEYSST